MEYYEAKAYSNLLKNNKNMFETNTNTNTNTTHTNNKKTNSSSKGLLSFLNIFKSNKSKQINKNDDISIIEENEIEIMNQDNQNQNDNNKNTTSFIPASNIESSKSTLF